MHAALTYILCGLSAVLLAMAGWYAARDRLFDDRLLAVAGVVEIALLVQLVTGLIGLGRVAGTAERATFVAYLLTLPVIPVMTAFFAIKEKTRWSMGAVAVGAFGVVVMVVRLQQIWGGHA